MTISGYGGQTLRRRRAERRGGAILKRGTSAMSFCSVETVHVRVLKLLRGVVERGKIRLT
jgi:hypothetical protein